jgi:hypothetical protein
MVKDSSRLTDLLCWSYINVNLATYYILRLYPAALGGKDACPAAGSQGACPKLNDKETDVEHEGDQV